MESTSRAGRLEHIPILAEDVPVVMPVLPASINLNLVQFKAISDPLRSRILGIIQQQPATAKQVAERLHATPGAIGHHLHVLEDAELAQVVARRLVRGTVANYYTRTARLFMIDLPPEISGAVAAGQQTITRVRDEIAETHEECGHDPFYSDAFLHMRLTPEHAQLYKQRLHTLVEEILQEGPDDRGQVYSLFLTMFTSPSYLQVEEVLANRSMKEEEDRCNQVE